MTSSPSSSSSSFKVSRPLYPPDLVPGDLVRAKNRNDHPLRYCATRMSPAGVLYARGVREHPYPRLAADEIAIYWAVVKIGHWDGEIPPLRPPDLPGLSDLPGLVAVSPGETGETAEIEVGDVVEGLPKSRRPLKPALYVVTCVGPPRLIERVLYGRRVNRTTGLMTGPETPIYWRTRKVARGELDPITVYAADEVRRNARMRGELAVESTIDVGVSGESDESEKR